MVNGIKYTMSVVSKFCRFEETKSKMRQEER